VPNTLTVSYAPRIGDIVRVIARDERDCDDCPHFRGEAGRVGRVVRGHPEPTCPSHPYLVLFTAACVVETRFCGPIEICARHYAADDLELVERA
jgi:hypothetical protein